jgi:hypothetical protein
MLGRISGFVIEDGTDDVLFAVVCFSSAARMGEDARVVPWSLVDDEGEICVVHLPPTTVRSAPIFVAGTCCADAVFWQRVENHFHLHAA